MSQRKLCFVTARRRGGPVSLAIVPTFVVLALAGGLMGNLAEGSAFIRLAGVMVTRVLRLTVLR